MNDKKVVRDNYGERMSRLLKVAIHIKKGIFITDINKIVYCEALSNYTRIHLLKNCITATRTLSYIESKLPRDIFIRVHKSYLINKNCITCLKDNTTLLLTTAVEIPIARRKRSCIKESLLVDLVI